ncbi:dTMP kinase [Granulicella cerasi]|uniref:dTMP kinase n=1 Tax=Granulicella cerasi TaxID=741063 RepID=A0ABW1Z868_9BACT|nr:hypothetical protein [Granulicella cerasi]
MADANSGKLLVFEGGDGIGKSHLAKELSRFLLGSGIPVTQLSFPGRREGSLGNLVYSVHHRPAEFGIQTMTTLGLQALHIAAHLDEIASIILPALNSGVWVVLDRFWWSTWVYGVHGGADRSCLGLLIEAEKQAWGNVRPAAIFVVERQSALREEHTQQEFESLASLYAEIRTREEHNQPTFVIDNNELQASVAKLVQIAATFLQ